MNVRPIARALLGGIFIIGGWDLLQKPKPKVPAAEDVGVPIAKKMGLPTDPMELIKINGMVQFVGGILLALGWMPRLASLALAASLVPTTLSAHRFWEISDPEQRKMQMMHAFKNGSILGGLVMSALDHGGRPSLFWMTGKAADRVEDAVSSALDRVTS